MEPVSDGKFLQEVVSITFNQDSSMFAINFINNSNLTNNNIAKYSGHVNLASEILLYYSDPLVLAHRITPGYICRSIALLERTNILALVPIQKEQAIFTEHDVEKQKQNNTFVENLNLTNLADLPTTNRSQLFEPVPNSRRRRNDAEHAFLYDCQLKSSIQELSFKQPISRCTLAYGGNTSTCKTKFTEFRCVVICRQTIFIFTIKPGVKESKTLISHIDTGENIRMLGAINLSGSILICPTISSSVSYGKHGQGLSSTNSQKSMQSGVLQVVDLNKGKMSSIFCHKRELVYMELDHAGQKAATAGLLGTIIRVWGLEKQKLLYELRRGADPAIIYSFSFASLGLVNSGKLLICSSNKGTVHIWKTSGDSNVSNSSKKIQANRNETDSLYSDIANFVRHGSGTERRSICSFSIEPDDACFVKLLNNNKQELSTSPPAATPVGVGTSVGTGAASNINAVNGATKTSSNLCAIVVTKSGLYYKYHVDINRQLTSKLVKENLVEDSFNTSFS